MSRFKFGDILATVDRLGSVETDLEEYSVRLDHPDGESWIESRILTPRERRTAGTDYDLAFSFMLGLREALRDPERWQIEMSSRGQMSPEELEATLEMAHKLEPYLGEALSDAMGRIGLYAEHWEEKRKQSGQLGIGRPLHLPKHVRTKKDLANFFAYLHLVEDLSFHPDEDFNTYVDRTGAPTYTYEEAHERNRLMAEAHEVAKAEGLDISEVMLWVTAILENRTQEEWFAEIPQWVTKLSETWL